MSMTHLEMVNPGIWQALRHGVTLRRQGGMLCLVLQLLCLPLEPPLGSPGFRACRPHSLQFV
jgi:hypothetical protein